MAALLDHRPEHHPLWEQWRAAVHRELKAGEWIRAHPDAELQEVRRALSEIGFGFGTDGDLYRRRGAYALRLQAPLLGGDGRPTLGTFLVRCRQCGNVFATFSGSAYTCSDGCHAAALAAAQATRAARRRERSAASAALRASRTGCCLVCGSEFPLQRITAKTCSDRCRTRFSRHPVAPPLPPPAKGLPDLERQLRQQQPGADSPRLRSVIAAGRVRHRLIQLTEASPALGRWLQRQGALTQHRALTANRDSHTLLGPRLWQRLGIDRYTDADLGWIGPDGVVPWPGDACPST